MSSRPEDKLTRRQVMQMGAMAATAAAVPAATAQAKGEPAPMSEHGGNKPNVLLLMADQYRGDCLGIDGHPCIQTPNLDRLAKEGVHFGSAYTATPSCTPARAGLLTGLAPWNHGMLGYGRVAERYDNEMPRMMREAGYQTLGIGKMHWSPQRNLHGFHRTILDESSREESVDFRSDYKAWFMSEAPHLEYDATGIGWNDYRSAVYAHPEELHPTHWTGETAVRWLEGYDQDEPFFLKVSFARPHSPYDAPERFWRMYEDAGIPPAAVGEWASRYEERSDESNNIWHGDMGAEQVRRSRQGYYGNVTFIDEQVGRIVKTLENRGLLDNTLIIFTADHGDMTGDHHMWRKTYAYEASARIPMVMRWPEGLPDAPRGQRCSSPVELRDILPTCLSAAGQPYDPARFDGGNMLSLVQGHPGPWREYIDFEHDVCYGKSNHWNALANSKWKYIFHAFDGQEQLFDLENDPGELHDLAKDGAHSKTLVEWRQRMVDHLSVRGEKWVKNGKLQIRKERQLYSPNYPKDAKMA